MTNRIFLPSVSSMFREFDRSANCKKTSIYSINENEENYSIEMNIPGVKKEDIEIGVKEDKLSITASRKKMDKVGEEEKEVILSQYEESFTVNTKSIDLDSIEASLEDGILTLKLPKKEEIKYERTISIK